MLAVVTAHTGETLFEVATVKELTHDLRDDGAQETVTGLKTLFIYAEKGAEVPGQALPERRCAGFSLTVGLHLPGNMQFDPENLHLA